MTEERWHNFAKEKPSEDMEGRNFIVSNGHYEKIATWCGYWENEPFMGDRLCDEVVRWKFYFTPEEEKANKTTCNELNKIMGMVCERERMYYNAAKVDVLLAKKDKEIAELKARIQLDDDEMAGFLDLEEECGGGDLRNYIAELKAKLENVQASMYADVVDANMEIRRLKRALWLARAERAKESHFMWCQFIYHKKYGIVKFNVRKEWNENIKQGQMLHTPQGWADVWDDVERKCREKAEEYK